VLTQESRDDPRINEIVRELLYWINVEVADERIVVKNIQEDFYDGQVTQKLIEKLADIRIEVPEVSQSEEGQKQKWRVIVDALNRSIGAAGQQKWSAELIHQKV
jgi:parvin